MAPAPHALVIPYPAQGHVIPFLELAHELVDRGFTVTFVNSEFNHDRVVAAMSSEKTTDGDGNAISADDGLLPDRIRLVAVPDGMAPGEDRNNLVRLTVLMRERMAPAVEELILLSRAEEDVPPITCMVVDYNLGSWALGVARRTGIKSAAIWPASAAVLASLLSIPKLVQDNVIDPKDGSVLRQETFQLSPDMPVMHTAHLAWNCIGDHGCQAELFANLVDGVRAVDGCDFVLCNSFHDTERATFARFPKVIPIGPLRTGEPRRGAAVGHFWRPEDSACVSWLDAQEPRSVVYVAFGSFTMFDQRQFRELALGLELSNRPFLWVVRPDIGLHGAVHDYPAEFLDRVAGRGMVVSWSPQQRVLAHPAVACFVSHCGWNSTMEGLRNGVPFLAWPYFADQFVNRDYICDVWKVGVRVEADEEAGVITKEHMAGRLEELIGDARMRERAEALKKVANESIQKGGSSYHNFEMFVETMRA